MNASNNLHKYESQVASILKALSKDPTIMSDTVEKKVKALLKKLVNHKNVDFLGLDHVFDALVSIPRIQDAFGNHIDEHINKITETLSKDDKRKLKKHQNTVETVFSLFQNGWTHLAKLQEVEGKILDSVLNEQNWGDKLASLSEENLRRRVRRNISHYNKLLKDATEPMLFVLIFKDIIDASNKKVRDDLTQEIQDALSESDFDRLQKGVFTELISEIPQKDSDGKKLIEQNKVAVELMIQNILSSSLSFIDKDIYTENLFKKSLQSKRIFNRMVNNTRNELDSLEKKQENKSIIRLSSDTPKDFIPEEVLKILGQQPNIYVYNESIVLIEEEGSKTVLKTLDPIDLISLCSRLCVFYKHQNSQDVSIYLKQIEAESILRWPELYKHLKSLRLYSNTLAYSPFFTLYKHQYDPEHLTYVNSIHPVVEYNKSCFDEFIGMISFHDKESELRFCIYLHIMLLRFVIQGPNPILSIIGPSQVGKTTLLEVLEVLFAEGIWLHVKDNAEFEKQLGAAMLSGEEVVNIDNYRSDTSSFTALEAYSTARELNVRKLGSNEFIHRDDNNILFRLTTNGGKMSPDVENRSIIVGLDYSFQNNSAEIPKRSKDILAFVRQNRDKILGHLMYEIEHKLFVDDKACVAIKKHWKQASYEIGTRIYDQEPYIKTGIFDSYVLGPVLKMLPVNSRTDGFLAKDLLLRLTNAEKAFLNERIGNLSGTIDQASQVLSRRMAASIGKEFRMDGISYQLIYRSLHNNNRFSLISKEIEKQKDSQVDPLVYEFITRVIDKMSDQDEILLHPSNQEVSSIIDKLVPCNIRSLFHSLLLELNFGESNDAIMSMKYTNYDEKYYLTDAFFRYLEKKTIEYRQNEYHFSSEWRKFSVETDEGEQEGYIRYLLVTSIDIGTIPF